MQGVVCLIEVLFLKIKMEKESKSATHDSLLMNCERHFMVDCMFFFFEIK